MSIPVIAFFGNRGGAGTTSMVYHLSWMFADRGLNVLAADLDPQSQLTAAFLDEDRLQQLLEERHARQTVFGAIEPLVKGTGDIGQPHFERIADRLGLAPGDMALSSIEEQFSGAWAKCMDRDEHSFRVTSAFYRVVQEAGRGHQSDVILFDLGPNLGAINRAALIASDYIAIPLGPDLFSLQGLENLGCALRRWRNEWTARLEKNPVSGLSLPTASIRPIGYILLRQSVRLDRPVRNFDRWIAGIPSAYARYVLDEEPNMETTVDNDPNCIAQLKDYRSLVPLAQEARKPLFFLKPADGALGAHAHAVASAHADFKAIATKIAGIVGLNELT